MKMNEGTVDRMARIIGGVVVLSLVFWGPQSSFGYLGLIPLITGIAGFCPLYSLLGLNTCPHRAN